MDINGRTPLHEAARYDCRGKEQYAVKTYTSHEYGRDRTHSEPQFREVLDGMLIAEELLAGGADINGRDRHGRTPLHLAAIYGGPFNAVLWRLLELGADTLATDEDGKTFLHLAMRYQQWNERHHVSSRDHWVDRYVGRLEKSLERLVPRCDVNAKDNSGWTALDEAEFLLSSAHNSDRVLKVIRQFLAPRKTGVASVR
jgi:ankyrin repeat protein